MSIVLLLTNLIIQVFKMNIKEAYKLINPKILEVLEDIKDINNNVKKICKREKVPFQYIFEERVELNKNKQFLKGTLSQLESELEFINKYYSKKITQHKWDNIKVLEERIKAIELIIKDLKEKIE